MIVEEINNFSVTNFYPHGFPHPVLLITSTLLKEKKPPRLTTTVIGVSHYHPYAHTVFSSLPPCAVSAISIISITPFSIGSKVTNFSSYHLIKSLFLLPF